MYIQATQISKDLDPKVSCWRYTKKRKDSFYYSLMILMISIKPWTRELIAKYSLLTKSSLSLTIKDPSRETIYSYKMVSRTHTLENVPTLFFWSIRYWIKFWTTLTYQRMVKQERTSAASHALYQAICSIGSKYFGSSMTTSCRKSMELIIHSTLSFLGMQPFFAQW